ncbi:MAG: ATP-binding cassette domain-containing protein [Pseudomonadota bacterium]
MDMAIETQGLSKRLGGRPVVVDVALAVPRGAVYGFLGPNGAGKTTVMRLLLGLMRRDAGSVSLLGHAMPDTRATTLAQVGAFVESPGLYDHLSGRANLDLTRRLRGLAAVEVDRVLDLVGMAAAAGKRVAACSLGMKQRLALARALLGDPQLLLLDEPTNGLDPEGIVEVRDLIRTLPARTGCTVFVSSHLLGEVEQVATHMGMMRSGRLVLQGRVDALLGGGRGIRIALDDPARGAALLVAAGFAATVQDNDAVRISCGTADLRPLAAAANQALVTAGLTVWQVAPEAPSLETLYRDTMQTEDAA